MRSCSGGGGGGRGGGGGDVCHTGLDWTGGLGRHSLLFSLTTSRPHLLYLLGDTEIPKEIGNDTSMVENRTQRDQLCGRWKLPWSNRKRQIRGGRDESSTPNQGAVGM